MRTTLAAMVAFVLGCGIFINGQNPPATNLAGAPFPIAQYAPNNLTARSRTTVNGRTRLEGVEIRTMGIVLRANAAEVGTSPGEYQLIGNVTATLVPIRPIWPNTP